MRIAALAALLSATLLATPAAAWAQPAAPDALVGRWVYASGKKGKNTRKKAILKATEDVAHVARVTARRVLAADTHVDPSLTFTREGDKLTLASESMPGWTAALDGRAVRVKTPKGKPGQMAREMKGGDLVQTDRVGKRTRIRRFEIRKGGKRLRLHVEVKSDNLPKAVRYHLDYRKVK